MEEEKKLPQLPPSGKPYYLLTLEEVESFHYYKEHGGRLGVNVSLKYINTPHAGAQLVVVVKMIAKEVVVNKKTIIEALADFHSSHADASYKERLINADAVKVGDLFKVSTKETITVSHQYTKSDYYINSDVIEVENGVYVPKPKGMMEKVKFLFGLY